MSEYRTAFNIIVEPDNSEEYGYLWELSMPAQWMPAGRHVVAEGYSRWYWKAKLHVLIAAMRLPRTRIEAKP